MNKVIIASDISNSREHKITTWAGYIQHDGGVIKQSGKFKEFYLNTALAETLALINTLVIAKKNVPNWDKSKVVIYSEIEYVLDPCKTKAGNIRLRDQERAEAIQQIAIPILKEAVEWDRKKVKAHYPHWQQSSNPTKYLLNQWCDREAKRMMRYYRDAIKN